MARMIEAVVPSHRAERMAELLAARADVVGLSLQRGASRKPEGDIIRVHVTTDDMGNVVECLAAGGALSHGMMTILEPTAVLAPLAQDRVDRESNEALWEETASLIRRDTNVSVNYLTLMAASGSIAAVGLLSDTVHIVVGAMLLAPGFEPLIRIPFGLLARGQRTTWISGVRSVLAGYAALGIGAAAMALVLLAFDKGNDGTLDGLRWVGYWTSPSVTAPLIAVVAGVAGAMVVSSRRTLFATGVMVALALVPGISILGMGLAFGDVAMAGKGLVRWAIDAACVLLAGGTVLAVKRRMLHWRRVMD